MATTPTRIYIIRSDVDVSIPLPRLVRAKSAAQALRHVARDLSVEVPTQDELIANAGVKVEVANPDD